MIEGSKSNKKSGPARVRTCSANNFRTAAKHRIASSMPTTEDLQSGLHLVKSLRCLLEKVEDQRCAEVALLLALIHLEDLRKDRIVDVVSKVQHVVDVLVV